MNENEFIGRMRSDPAFRTRIKKYLFFYGAERAGLYLSHTIRVKPSDLSTIIERFFWKEYQTYLFMIKQNCLRHSKLKRKMMKALNGKIADEYNNFAEPKLKASLYILEAVKKKYFS